MRYLILRIQSWHFYLASCSMLQNPILLQKKISFKISMPNKARCNWFAGKNPSPSPQVPFKPAQKFLIFPTKMANNTVAKYLVVGSSNTRHYHLRSIFQYFPAPKHPFGMCQTHQFCRLLIINFEGGGHLGDSLLSCFFFCLFHFTLGKRVKKNKKKKKSQIIFLSSFPF